MQSSQRKGVESVDTQSLFDQMYAVQLNSKGEPFVSGENIEEYIPDQTYQVDPTDAVMILKGPLLEAAASGGDTWTESERIVIADCIKRLEQCEKLIESTTIGKFDPVRRFTKEDFAFVNKFVSDTESVLKVDFTNDQTWGNNLPSALLLKDIMGGLPLSDIGDEKFMVRGKSYFVDNKKVAADQPLFFLRGIQVVEQPRGTSDLAGNIAMRDWCGFPKTYDQYNEWLILNYMVPGSTTVNVVCLFTASREALEVINSINGSEVVEPFQEPVSTPKQRSPFKRTQKAPASTGSAKTQCASPVMRDRHWANSVYRFWSGSDDYRNRTFKLFPRICKASWAIQAAVGTKPALIGNKKLELKYLRGPGYLEVDIDLSSSTIATHILGMVRGVSKSMVVDLGVGIEGFQEDELPEAILCQARFDRVDLDMGSALTGDCASASHSAKTMFSEYMVSLESAKSPEGAQAGITAVDSLKDIPAQKLRRALGLDAKASTK